MIQSILVDIPPNEDGHTFLVFDTVFDHKHTFTACGIGRLVHGEPNTSPVGALTLDALARYANTKGALRFIEIATVAAAPMRVRKALESADSKDALFFLCRSSDVYDAAVIALNVNMDSGSNGPKQ